MSILGAICVYVHTNINRLTMADLLIKTETTMRRKGLDEAGDPEMAGLSSVQSA